MRENISREEAIRYLVEDMSAEARIEFVTMLFPSGEACLDLAGQVVIYTDHYEETDCNRIKFTDEDCSGV